MSYLQVLGISFLFMSYVIYIKVNFKELPSISHSWYMFNNRKKFFFTLFCLSNSLILVNTNSLLLFLAGVCFAFTGIAGPFKNRLTKYIHNIHAVLGILFIFAYISLSNWLIPLIWIGFTILLIIFLKKNKLFWIEVCSFIFASFGLYLTI
ncbi:MAG: hypothetical protein WC123_03570 [Bacilli bacterium]